MFEKGEGARILWVFFKMEKMCCDHWENGNIGMWENGNWTHFWTWICLWQRWEGKTTPGWAESFSFSSFFFIFIIVLQGNVVTAVGHSSVADMPEMGRIVRPCLHKMPANRRQRQPPNHTRTLPPTLIGLMGPTLVDVPSRGNRPSMGNGHHRHQNPSLAQ